MGMTKKQSLTKTITWRVLATSDTFLLGLIVIMYFGEGASAIEIAGGIAGLEVITKMFLYYFHERAWAWKLEKDKTTTEK